MVTAAALAATGIGTTATAAPLAADKVARATPSVVERAWPGAKTSSDLAVGGYGDGEGYHLQVARESDGFAWRDLAVIRPAGLDEPTWYGYQCLSGDGREVAVAILPGGLVNRAAARARGAYAYAVDVTTGHVRPLQSGVSFQYSSPGCGTGGEAAFTSSLDDEGSVTSVVVDDLATGKAVRSSVVAGQATSVVPVGSAAVATVDDMLVRVAAGGSPEHPQTPQALTRVGGQAFDLHPSADGGVDLLVTKVGSTTGSVQHWDGSRLATWGSGPLARVRLDGGRGGHNVVSGVSRSSVPSRRLKVDTASNGAAVGAVSLEGDALFAAPPGERAAAGQPLSRVISAKTHDALTATTLTGLAPQPVTRTSTSTPDGIELRGLVQPASGVATPEGDGSVHLVSARTASAPAAAGAAATLTAAQTPKCAVPRLDPARQSLQPSPAQADWAAQMAAQGLLVGSAYTRPANYANMGLAAYAPSSDFARISLHHPSTDTWDTVPRSVVEAIMAQESNFDQASWHALPGIAGAPLIGDYYGAAGSIRSISYANADCGYGIMQVTTGMAATDTSITTNGKAKVGVDYEENIAAGLRILQSTWNTLYDAGITANGGDPRYLENWYMAIWAYNSGIQPTAAFGNTTGCTPSPTCTGKDGTWGLGWSNNPINPSYPPNRAPFLQATYADAAHPGDWPYQERVMGWMASPIIRLSHASYSRPTYALGQSWLQIPPRATFCTSANLCDPSHVDSANPTNSYCTLADYQCWWHQAVSWVPSCSSTCATSSYEYTTGSTEPSYSSPHPPTCNADPAEVPAGSIIVDDLPAPVLNRQGCANTSWKDSGTFTLSYGLNSAGDPTAQIDTHQLGAGFGGHIYFTHTEAKGDTAVTDTGTWTPGLPSLQYYKVRVHIPATGAAATDVVYKIYPSAASGLDPWQIRVNQDWGSEEWVTLGTFALDKDAYVTLTNESSMTPGKYDVAFDAVAFVPEGGNPALPIGGALDVKDAPKGSNPAWKNCTCATREEGDPVDTATGYLGASYVDLFTPGRGTSLRLTRTYDSALADPAGPSGAIALDGPFGHGWISDYAMTASTDSSTGNVVVAQEDGSQVGFVASGGTYTTAKPRMDATLTLSSGQYTFARGGTDVFVFDVATGHLVKATDTAGLQASPQYWTTFAYDSSGHLKTVTDPAARAYTFTWTGTHITSVTDGSKRQVDYVYSTAGDLTDVFGPNTVRSGTARGDQDHMQFTYDTHHLMLTMRSPEQFGSTATPPPVTTNVYDASERVVKQTNPLGGVTTFTYGPATGLVAGQTLVTDPAGHQIRYTYQNGLPVSVTHDPSSSTASTWTYQYDPISLGVAIATDPLGNKTTYSYDDHGNLVSSSDALGRTTSYKYDGQSRLVQTTNPAGLQTSITYNAAGLPTATAYGRPGQTAEVADGNPVTATVRTTSATYADAAHPGDVTSTTDQLGKVTSYAYDAAGDVTKVTDALGRSTLARYDLPTGKLTAIVSARGVAAGTAATCTPPAAGCTTYEYDARGATTAVHDAAGHTVATAYDRDGHPVSSTDALGHVTTTTYDAAGEAVTVKRPDGKTTSTTYTPDGQVATTVDAAGAATTYTYDTQGRRTSMKDPDARTTKYAYDLAGQLTTLTQPDGTVTTTSRDAGGEIVNVAYSGGTTHGVTASYDTAGRRVAMTDGTGTTTTAFDDFGEPVSVTNGAGQTVGYGYDARGEATSITYPGSRVLTRVFDAAGQLTSVKDWNSLTTSFGYDADGDQTTTTYPNGTTAATTVDAVGAPLTAALTKGTTSLAGVTYTRNASENLATRASTGAGATPTQTYSYDALDQVTKVAASATTSYTYDAARHPTAVGAATQSFDAAGTLCWTATSGTGTCSAPPTGATVYGRDADGRRTSAKVGTTTNAAYTWDQAGELVKAVTPAGTSTYTYDGDGLRATATTGATTVHDVWDRTVGVPTLLSDDAEAYVYGPGGRLVEQVGTAATQWVFADGQGSTIALTDSTGAVAGSYTYDAWGRTTAHTGVASALQYGGQLMDATTGFLYLRARYYDPATTQFVSIDPLVATTLAAYLYGSNDPLNRFDPTGAWSKKTWLKIGLGAAMIALAATGVGVLADGIVVSAAVASGAAAFEGSVVTTGVVATTLSAVATTDAAAIAVTADTIAVGAGGVALAIDTSYCFQSDDAACDGAAQGALAEAGGVAALQGDIAKRGGGLSEAQAMEAENLSKGGAYAGGAFGSSAYVTDSRSYDDEYGHPESDAGGCP